jgi:hypothetical protein
MTARWNRARRLHLQIAGRRQALHAGVTEKQATRLFRVLLIILSSIGRHIDTAVQTLLFITGARSKE